MKKLVFRGIKFLKNLKKISRLQCAPHPLRKFLCTLVKPNGLSNELNLFLGAN